MRAAQKRAKKLKRMREAAENMKVKEDLGSAEPDADGPTQESAVNLENMDECFQWYSSAGDSFRCECYDLVC